ncbi:MAG TPA: N-acetyl-gamma-glutamyl-phosphate reductase [Planctomycetota bacterium]|nr:N-acetyl-gamma-glutamyl-phosphate reductase [Planctomycetota bacterium]
MKKVRTVVIGASGYIGGEAVRLLLGHPGIELVAITANENAGKRLDEVQPNLRGYSDLVYQKEWPEAEAYMLSLPHGEAMSVVPRLKGKVVDLSGDFRLQDVKQFEKYYKAPHKEPELLKKFAYGIPEINRGRIKEARYVAAGGCFASAAILSLWPLRGLAAGRAIVDGKTGSSGSGIKPGEKTHHPFRSTSFFAYEMFHHRHTPEIEAASGVEVLFQPHSTPLVRGVFTTSYVPLQREMTADEVLEVFRTAYAGERFVRLSKGTTNVNTVKGSNFIDLGVAAEGRTAIVFAAIDNLVKGGAGQGVQCLNLMFGLPEEAGLLTPPAQP